MSNFVKIGITTTADVTGIKQTEAALGGLNATAAKTDASLRSLAAGFAGGIAAGAISQLAQIPAAIIEATKRGVLFNATMADSEKAIANLIQKFASLDKVTAENAAAGVMEKIIDLEPKVAGPLDTLVNGFQVALSASQNTNFRTLPKPVHDWSKPVHDWSKPVHGFDRTNGGNGPLRPENGGFAGFSGWIGQQGPDWRRFVALRGRS